MDTALIPIEWPSELTDPNQVVGSGYLDGDAKERLAVTETPFVVLACEQFAWPTGDMAIRLSLLIMPDGSDEHVTPWQATMALGLPRDPDPERPTDRERIASYFQMADDVRPIGPCVLVAVPTNQPQPYMAIRKAPARVMARYALQTPTPSKASKG